MPNDRPIDELIDKCLDKTAGEAERLELERRLQDADTRAAFVAAQRLNACLEALLKEETQTAQGRALVQAVAVVYRPSQGGTSMRPWKAMVGLAAAILILLGTGLWWQWHGKASRPSSLASNRQAPGSPAPADISAAEAVAMFGLASARAVK